MTAKDEGRREPDAVRLNRDRRLTVPMRQMKASSCDFADDPTAFEINFLEGVLKRDPCHIEALQILGHAYTTMGDHERGLQIDQRLVRLRPSDPFAFYNLACSLSLLQQADQSLTALRRAIELGYDDLAYMMEDDDLAPLRDNPRFREMAALMRKDGG